MIQISGTLENSNNIWTVFGLEKILRSCQHGIIEDEEVIRRAMINRGTCLSCRQICPEKFILDCGEMQFCGNCSNTIMSGEDPKCPKCNKRVTFRVKLS